MSEDLFANPNPNDPVIDPNKDYFPDLVGDDKKYKTNADAGRALMHQEAFIEKLKKEAEEARTELRSRLSVEEALKEVKDSMVANPAITPQENPLAPPQAAQTPVETNQSEQLSSTAIEDLVKNALKERDESAQKATQEGKLQANRESVAQKLTELYGPNFNTEVAAKAAEIGIDTTVLSNLASTEPKAFFRVLGIDGVATPAQDMFRAPTESTVNTVALNNSRSTGPSYAKYEQMRKDNPGDYFSTKVQSQMHKDALAQGAAFYDT